MFIAAIKTFNRPPNDLKDFTLNKFTYVQIELFFSN